jgi:hypothetical protein
MLQRASEAPVYDDLALARVTGYARTQTQWHDVTHFNVTLASPVFDSGLPEERFAVAVLLDVRTGRRTAAWDEFPLMRPAAVEAAWRRRVSEDVIARQMLLS